MKPMLAATVKDVNALPFPLYASYKLDGVRALVVDSVVLSRSLKPIPNKYVQECFGRREFNGLDGELIVGPPNAKDVYTKTTSGVMSIEGKPEVKFHVFDIFYYLNSTDNRLSRVSEYFKISRYTKVLEHVPQKLCSNVNELNEYEAEALALGYEGVMLRHPDALYKYGRSTLKEVALMKLKRFEDSEAVILGFTEEKQNTNEKKINELGQRARSAKKAGMVGKGSLGNFIVRDMKTNVEFEVGSGFTQADREKFWVIREDLLGKIVKYKFFPVGVKEKPRHPVYLGFRNKIDL
jgi:DNA ligase 1